VVIQTTRLSEVLGLTVIVVFFFVFVVAVRVTVVRVMQVAERLELSGTLLSVEVVVTVVVTVVNQPPVAELLMLGVGLELADPVRVTVTVVHVVFPVELSVLLLGSKVLDDPDHHWVVPEGAVELPVTGNGASVAVEDADVDTGLDDDETLAVPEAVISTVVVVIWIGPVPVGPFALLMTVEFDRGKDGEDDGKSGVQDVSMPVVPVPVGPARFVELDAGKGGELGCVEDVLGSSDLVLSSMVVVDVPVSVSAGPIGVDEFVNGNGALLVLDKVEEPGSVPVPELLVVPVVPVVDQVVNEELLMGNGGVCDGWPVEVLPVLGGDSVPIGPSELRLVESETMALAEVVELTPVEDARTPVVFVTRPLVELMIVEDTGTLVVFVAKTLVKTVSDSPGDTVEALFNGKGTLDVLLSVSPIPVRLFPEVAFETGNEDAEKTSLDSVGKTVLDGSIVISVMTVKVVNETSTGELNVVGGSAVAMTTTVVS
jgi:hypothetical protein